MNIQQYLPLGRLLSQSKSSYRERYPDHEVYFNANIITEKDFKVWYGDIDLTLDRDILVSIANESNTTLYILREMDARFDNEHSPIEVLKKRAVCVIHPNINMKELLHLSSLFSLNNKNN